MFVAKRLQLLACELVDDTESLADSGGACAVTIALGYACCFLEGEVRLFCAAWAGVGFDQITVLSTEIPEQAQDSVGQVVDGSIRYLGDLGVWTGSGSACEVHLACF